MQEKLYISASNVCAFKLRWVYYQHARFIFFFFSSAERYLHIILTTRNIYFFWQYDIVVHLVNFFTAWKVFITKCQRDMLSPKLWSHCLHSAHNQCVLFSPESHGVTFYPWWIVDAIMFHFNISRETFLIHLQHTTKTIPFNCPNELFVTLLSKPIIVIVISKISKISSYSLFPKLKILSSNCLFCLTNSAKTQTYSVI